MKKKIALITGASGGIGGACAETLARAGYTVLLHGCHGLEHAKALADRLCAEGCDAHAVCCDLADSESAQAMCRDILALYHRADALVLCAGLGSAALLRPLGRHLPLEAVHGYTVSAPVREDSHAPQGSVIDPLHRITITRQGQRVRVSGGAELGYAGGRHDDATLRTLYLALSGWFPGGALLSSPQVQVWRGARPTLTDGAPAIGASDVSGLWINTGHGACGWAQACGSARALADLIAQRSPAIDLQPFAPQRF